ncbi:hypothetical protein HMSSN139_62410 [Paenibacillus sp. HMSSN-139]|nr:hypothetical protein HMSSN139_62410 [Paenibacillus sp. HMSSN-139]
MNAAAKGYRIILVLPDNMTKERILLLRAYGAEVVLTPAALRMPGAIAKARELLAEIPGSFMPQQFQNPANPEIHRLTTGPEIVRQMEGRLDGFVATAGTGRHDDRHRRISARRDPEPPHHRRRAAGLPGALRRGTGPA